jgi:quinone-modifying oxidoreductase subunit QmoC
MEWPVRIKYEEDLDPQFADEIRSMPGGEAIRDCIQCGTCTGSCPVSVYMDYGPRAIIGMTRAGFKNEVLASNTIWICASCYSCTVECRRQIKITEVMYALKRRAIEEGAYPKRLPIPVLAREFYGVVMRYGRNLEGELLVRMYLKTNILRILGRVRLGLRLLRTGRMAIVPSRIKGRGAAKGSLRTVTEALQRNW